MSETLLSARSVTKSYTMGKRRLDVLRGVSLEVTRGEFVALRGASGAGKSTLLHLFGGLDSPNAGEIWFAGKNLAQASDSELTKLRNGKVGFIFQAYHLLPELDALENVCVPARLARVPADIAAKRGQELLQRVGIARALMNAPELILADEPTGNLDSHTGAEIVDLLVSLRAEKNTTLIIATHDASVAARAPKVIQLVDGQIQ